MKKSLRWDRREWEEVGGVEGVGERPDREKERRESGGKRKEQGEGGDRDKLKVTQGNQDNQTENVDVWR